MGVVKRDMAHLKAEAAGVGLETIFFQVTACMAQVTDTQ